MVEYLFFDRSLPVRIFYFFFPAPRETNGGGRVWEKNIVSKYESRPAWHSDSLFVHLQLSFLPPFVPHHLLVSSVDFSVVFCSAINIFLHLKFTDAFPALSTTIVGIYLILFAFAHHYFVRVQQYISSGSLPVFISLNVEVGYVYICGFVGWLTFLFKIFILSTFNIDRR